jgi:hypothetical protein
MMSDLNPAPATGVDEQHIRERAYILWEEAGCPEGQADEFWSLAQQEISMQEVAHDETPASGKPVSERTQRSVKAKLRRR